MTARRKNQNKPATMRDVAKLAGVSQPTVSRVLNQTDTKIAVSDETRERVLAAVEELGYRPNVLARSLRTQQTEMIAMLIADISNSFYHPMARAVQDVAREHGYDVLIANSDHLYENEKHFFEAVSRRPVDGVIIVPFHLTNEDIEQFISQTNTPVTVLGAHVVIPDVDVVIVDDELAIYEATRWLVTECHHDCIGYVSVPPDMPPGPRRISGFRHAMYDSGLTIDSEFLFEGDFSLESGIRVAHQMLDLGRLPSALVVSNDLMAIGIMLTLQEAGYRIPEDMAIIGFDNIPETTIVRPNLTTIAQQPRDIGQKLAYALFDRIENPTISARRVFESTCELIVRQST